MQTLHWRCLNELLPLKATGYVCTEEWAEHMKGIYHMLSPDPEGGPELATGPPQVFDE